LGKKPVAGTAYLANRSACILGSTQLEFEATMIKVYCKKCKEWINEKKVKVLDISEDICGRDKLKFICPKKHESESIRVGK
jgi:hypothetical protein